MVEEISSGSLIPARRQMGGVAVPRSRSQPAPHHAGSADDRAEPIAPTRSFDFAETLEALLEPYLPEGYPPARLAASLMSVSVRTLARRLSEVGITYRDLIDRVRFRVARRLLRDTDMRVSDVADAVGFADSSNFARMFRRVGGLSPLEFREQVVAEN